MSGDWTGTGELTCYSHLNAQVSTPPGSENESEGKLTCTPIEWPYPAQDLGPEAMFFAPNGGAEFEIWAVSVGVMFEMLVLTIMCQWDYHEPNIPWAECDGDVWYQNSDMGAGYCTPNMDAKSWSGCGLARCTGSITCYGC